MINYCCQPAACSSSIRNDSLDASLLITNGTYIFTANNCVKCGCDSANNWMSVPYSENLLPLISVPLSFFKGSDSGSPILTGRLQCQPSGLRPSNWSVCPSVQCEGTGLYIGNTSLVGCDGTTCAYAGYTSQAILTTISTDSTCPGISLTQMECQTFHLNSKLPFSLSWWHHNFTIVSLQGDILEFLIGIIVLSSVGYKQLRVIMHWRTACNFSFGTPCWSQFWSCKLSSIFAEDVFVTRTTWMLSDSL